MLPVQFLEPFRVGPFGELVVTARVAGVEVQVLFTCEVLPTLFQIPADDPSVLVASVSKTDAIQQAARNVLEAQGDGLKTATLVTVNSQGCFVE